MEILIEVKEQPGTYRVKRGSVLSEADIFVMARELAIKKMKAGEVGMTSPSMISEFLRSIAQSYEREVFGVIHLNTTHQVIDVDELFFGTVNQAACYPRDLVKSCLARNSSAIVIYHNHPSGNTKPSHSDRVLTNRIKEALALVDVRVLDHFVVSATEATSFADMGWM